MRSFAAKPRSPVLRQLIKAFHYQESEFPFARERIAPSGQAYWMINLAEDEFRTYGGVHSNHLCKHTGAVMAGAHAKSLVIDTREQRWFAAVEFRPGGASAFLKMPMTEVSNQVVALEDVWPMDGPSVRERLLDAPTPSARFWVFEELLMAHLRPPFDPAIHWAVNALGAGMPVAQVASQMGFSRRTLERRFSDQVGMGPKRFGRVRRLQRVLRSVRRSGNPDWCALAAEYGFTDQAHLIHEFQDLISITPSGYKPHSPQRSNHIPIVQG